MFKVNDHIVYPDHGKGIIKNISKREIFGKEFDFAEIEIDSGLTILARFDQLETIGVKHVQVI